MDAKNIYDHIVNEENAFKTSSVTIAEGYEWNMYEHCRKTILYKNSVYISGKSDDKPYKNIIRPILNVAYRAEGFDVKDIQLFVEDPKNYYKSFLIKKFHEKWARENGIDTFIDDLVETYVDFGGALVKDVNDIKPEVVPWSRIAFVDQTDILSGTIAEKHYYAPDQLREMSKKGWKNIDEVITLSNNYKRDKQTSTKQNKTPGRYIEVYELHGMFPKSWLAEDGEDYTEEDASTYTRQIHICTFYKAEGDINIGITLFKGPEKELPYKLILRDKIYGRALGIGGAEELFEPQVWVNYDVIRIKEMLDIASKVIFQTADAAFANRNKTSGLENGEILITEEGKTISQINTQPVNVNLFENSVSKWEEHARQMGAANEAIMGEAPSAGTPFKLQELITAESHSLHEYRKGKLATFIDEIYKDWEIPHIANEIVSGSEFLADLELDELQDVTESIATCEANKFIKTSLLQGKVLSQSEIDVTKDVVKRTFNNGGSRKFIEIFKDEMKDAPLSVYVNIKGKQKDLAGRVDKLVNILRQIISAPQMLQDPVFAKLFNQIIESSGLDPVDFSSMRVQPTQTEQLNAPQQPAEVPLTTPQPAY